MRKQFVRLFLGFVMVVAVILGIQLMVFWVTITHQRKNWTESVFQEYLTSFARNLEHGLSLRSYSLFTIEELLLSSADDRVSGLYIRNPDGTVAIAYGKTSSGTALPVPRGQQTFSITHQKPEIELAPAQVEVSEHGFISSEMQGDVYLVEIMHTGTFASIYVTKQPEPQKQTFLLPPQVKATDIAGSLVIIYNEETLALVDILTYTPFTYKNTGYLFKGLFYPILWAMPIAFVIALMMAASISKRSERYTRGIQTALAQLSEGEHDIVLPKTKIDEQKVINSSISMLDQHLKQHKQSRQAWLRSITHDLNTPVTSMKLMLDGLCDGVFPLNDQTILSIKKENDVLSERIAAVVLYANLQSPDMKATKVALSVTNFLDQVLYDFAPELRRRINVEADNAVLQADSTLLAHAIKALLDNALKACDQTITLSISENKIQICNPGTLIDGVDFFEPWSRGDYGRSTEGSGLGLPIVGQVMRLHGGSASIEQLDDHVVVTLKW